MLSLRFSRNLFLFIAGIIIIGGFLILVSANEASAAATCSCASGRAYNATDDAIAQYGNEAMACAYYCAADGGVSSVSPVTSTNDWINCDCNGTSVNILPPETCEEACPSTDLAPASGGGDTSEYDTCVADCSSASDVNDCEDGCYKLYGTGNSDGTTGVENTNQNKLPGADNTKQGATGGQGSASLPNFLGITDIKSLFLKIVNFLTLLAMPFAVLMLIWSGFLFVTAQGNDTKLVTARKNLIWTIAGIAVIVAANLIVGYIMEALGVSSAGAGSAMFEKVKATLNQIIGLLFILVTVYFGWGVTQFVRASATGGKEVAEGKKHMVWGIIGMAVMLGAWTIVGILQSFFK